MIKLFRNIRQKLLKEDQTANYLKYAIGEIVLVVIGILIALQINNWNEHSKDRNYEHSALTELYESLHYEYDTLIPMLLKRVEVTQHGINEFMELRERHETISDSLFNKLWDEINVGAYFSYEAGPFEAIKNRGLNLITNDTLRSILVKLYESNFPRIQNHTDSYSNKYDFAPQLASLEDFLLETKAIKAADGNWHFQGFPKNPDMIYSKELINYLKIKNDVAEHFTYRMGQINGRIEKVLEALRLELKITDHD